MYIYSYILSWAFVGWSESANMYFWSHDMWHTVYIYIFILYSDILFDNSNNNNTSNKIPYSEFLSQEKTFANCLKIDFRG